MSIDDPMGGIFERLGISSGHKESSKKYRQVSFEVACVKRILTWALPARQVTKLVKQAAADSASGQPDFEWLYHQFEGFPLRFAALPRLQANWHITSLWGNQFAKHPIVKAYHEAAEEMDVDLAHGNFAILTRCTNWHGTSVLSLHNLKVSVDTTKRVEDHSTGDKHNTRIIRAHRNHLYCIDDLISMMELVGKSWTGE
jgi:hypothetical protein